MGVIDSRVTSFCNLNATLTCSENRNMALYVSFRPLVSSYLVVEFECDMTLATFMFFLVQKESVNVAIEKLYRLTLCIEL